MADNETIADVLAAMRDEAARADMERDYSINDAAEMMREFAWRFEAAHKRERDEMLDALVRIGNWCAQDLAENAFIGDASGNYEKTLHGLCDVCRPFMQKASKLKRYGGANG